MAGGFIGRLLAKDKQDRFTSASEVEAALAEELAHLQNPTSVQAPRRTWLESRSPQAAASDARSWKSGMGLAGTALLAIIAAVAFTLSNGTADPEPSESVQGQAAPAADVAAADPEGEGLTPSNSNANPRFASPSADEKLATTPSDRTGTAEPFGADDDVGTRTSPHQRRVGNAVALAYPIAEIKIDGDLSDWPDDLPSYLMERAEVGAKPSSGNDLEGRFRIGYNADENALYVAVEVVDQSRVVDSGAWGAEWNQLDGCEIYIDQQHQVQGSSVAQYARYGESLNAFGANSGIKGVDLMVGEQAGDRPVHCYEWRVQLNESVTTGRSIGFDAAVTDKDADGSFTWLAWGKGTHKVFAPGRCGAVVFVDRRTELGDVAGTVAVQGAKHLSHPRVRLQSVAAPELWVLVESDDAGAYRARLPVGEYWAEAVGNPDVRVEQDQKVSVVVAANEIAEVDAIRATAVASSHGPSVWAGPDLVLHGEHSSISLARHGGEVRNDSIAIARPMPAIKVDGDLSDWPADMTTYAIARTEFGVEPLDDADLKAEFRVGYNPTEQLVYVAVEIDDDVLVLDRAAGKDWTAQDGAEIYLDSEHRVANSRVEQHSFYGESLQQDDSSVRVVQSRNGKRRAYEWALKPDDVVAPGRSLGFDVAVLDRDDDDSFSWCGWGAGTQKAWFPDRIGNLLLVDADTALGEVVGTATLNERGPDRRICFQSLHDPALRPRIACDSEGRFQAELPVGRYLVHPVGQGVPSIQVEVNAGQRTELAPLKLRVAGGGVLP